jgi:hypothetical protein
MHRYVPVINPLEVFCDIIPVVVPTVFQILIRYYYYHTYLKKYGNLFPLESTAFVL